MPSDIDAIHAVVEEWATAVSADDLDQFIQIFTEDARFIPSDAPGLRGKDAIRSFGKENFFDPYLMRGEISLDKLDVGESRAIGSSRYMLWVTPRDGGDEVSETGEFTGAFSKESDGSWKWSSVIFTRDAPLGS